MLEFDIENHAYKQNGFAVPSVTSIVDFLNRGRYAPSPVMENARLRGLRVHELCELFDIGAELDLDPETMPFILAYERFVRDYRPEWLFLEKKLGSAKDKFAGTVDRLGLIDGKACLVDIKTTANFDRMTKITLAVQLVGYAMLCADNQLCWPDKLYGVQLKLDASYRVFEVTEIEKQYKFNAFILFNKLLELERFRGGYP